MFAMNGSSRTATFMKSPLVTWVKTLQKDDKCHKEIKDFLELNSGIFLHKVWLQIDPQPPFQSINTAIEETGSRIRNLSTLLNNIKAFYENVLGQTLVIKLPDVIKIASNSNDETASCEEMRVLLLLLLGCAVQCERKEHFIDGIKQLDISVQHSIVECIQLITDNPESVWVNSEWSLLPEDESEKERLYTILVQHINKLVKERDELLQRVIDLAFELDNICPNASSQISSASMSSIESSNSLFISSPNLMNSVGEQKSHLLVELAEVKSKLRRVQQELEEKNEVVSELKEILEQNKESCNKLRQDNLELIQEARSAKAYRDEIDVLNERVRKVDRLENEVQRYRDKMNELDFYKSRVEELREDNRILSETKVMLEEQLDGSRKRADQLPELEAQILKLSAYTNELVIQRDLDRNQIEGLIEEITHLRLDKKSTADELSKVQSELTNLKCQMKMDLLHQNSEGNLFEQINNDASKRVLKLELENQRLQSLVENIKNNRTTDTTASFLNNNHQLYSSNRMNGDDIPNGNSPMIYTDDMLSPGDMSITSDSASLSLSADFNAKLEKIENENECLRNTVERVKRAESKISELEMVRNDLQNELKDLKSKRNGDSIKFEQIERNASQLVTENQRLQRLIDNNSKRYDEAQHEIQALESENQKLLATAETLKLSVKRLNDLEREVTNLEAENHRFEQEKKSVDKEILRLKQAIDVKDSAIDDYANRLSTVELENKRIRKDSENNNQTAVKLKSLEKVNKQISNELFVSKKTVTTLRQDLVNEKIKSQQLSDELEKVNNALEKIYQKSHLDNSFLLNNDLENKDWVKLLEDVFDNIIKKSLEQKELKITTLENKLKETMDKNVELNSSIQSLKRRIETTTDETQPTVNHNLVSELQRKVTLIEDENKNLKNENITHKDTIIDIMTKYKSLESNFECLNSKNIQLQSDQAKLEVENSLVKSQNSSLQSQTQTIQTQIASIQEIKDKLQQKCQEFENNYKILLNDHEALQALHQQLTADYETQSSNSSGLKLLYKNLRAEHKAVQEKLEAWLQSQEDLQKMKDEIESRGDLSNNNQTNVEMIALKEENKLMNEEHKRLQTEYKMLQNIYKKLRTDNNDLKLKHTELQGETAECRDRMSLLDVEVSKLSNYCEMVALTNNSLECHRKRLITSMSSLLSQYHEMLTEIADDSEKLVTDKMHDLCAKKEKLEKMIKDYDVTLEKKKVSVTNPNVVRRIHRSTTDLCLSKNQNSRDRNSAPIDTLVDEAIYGRIWEAETPPIPSNTAILRPFRNNNVSTLEQNNSRLMENMKTLNNDTINQTKDELQKPELNSVLSPVPPPRPPPRVSTTIENKMTISVITSPTRSSPLNNSSTSFAATPMSGTTRSTPYLYNNNFTRGTFKSNSINYGSPIRRQPQLQPLKNGHHHIHHFHHMHPHSASPSLNSDSSLTPVEDSELSDSAGNNSNHRSRNLNNIDNVTVNSNVTNSIWYEYGCV